MWKDSETSVDYLDYKYLIDILNDIIRNDELTPSTIGIYGDWGSGKSSLIGMSKNELETLDGYVCVSFNGWLFENYEDAKSALMGTILDEISAKRTIEGKAKDLLKNLYKNIDFLKIASKGMKYGLDMFLTGGIGTVADISLSTIKSAVSLGFKDKLIGTTEDDIEKVLKEQLKDSEIRKSVKSFHSDFSELLKATKVKRLVVYIDELDRCSPDTILSILEAIRLFLFSSQTAFIIGADERHISYAVKRKFEEIEGNQIDIGKEYLEKLVQYPIRIPQLNKKAVENYIMYLFFSLELTTDEFEKTFEFLQSKKDKDFLKFEISFELISNEYPKIAKKVKKYINLAKQLSAMLTVGLNGNPRQCKRFLNTLIMRMKMSEYRNAELQLEVLSKLMMLEYFQTDIFKKLSILQEQDNGFPTELALIEENKWDDTEVLALWKENEWINNWIEIEPKLAGINLQPYYYFVRESLAYNLNVSQKLSIKATEVLEKLLSSSKVNVDKAIEDSGNVNEAEANLILEKLKEKLQSKTSLDAKLFKAILKWGASKESLISSTISFLKSIDASRVRFSHIPDVKMFMEQSKKEAEIRGILEVWSNENEKLKTAIDNILKER